MDDKLNQSLVNYIWKMKYAYSLEDQPMEQTVEAMWNRVAKAVSMAENKEVRKNWASAFYSILEDYRFLPGGRILAGAGTRHQVTLFNCFVMNIAEDSLKGIFKALAEGALTLQQGGGVGYDFSILRPKGAFLKKTGTTAAGPVSFMHIWDAACHTLLSTGRRRGAMMGVLRCDHPDILAFIKAKQKATALRHFNISVMVSDDFMQAVKEDKEWQLVFPCGETEESEQVVYKCWGGNPQPQACRIYAQVSAKQIWQEIIQAAYDYAEPGVLFSDSINRMNNLWYQEYLAATNPCGEIPLPSYGACDLGSINLTAFVIAPFTPQASINWTGLEETARIATRFLDNVIDISRYPLSAQRYQAKHTRRIGLGLTGLADAFVMLGVKYGSSASIDLAAAIMKKICDITWITSIELAEEKGTFLDYQTQYLEGAWVRTLDENIYADLRKHGVRNSHHNAIAPTGTISLLANNISNGIEPIFKAEYERQVLTGEGKPLHFTVQDHAYRYWKQIASGPNALDKPPAWIDTTSLLPDAHLNIQAVMQKYVDNAISKTINIPSSFPFDQVVDVYTKAYELGLKGCTIFRPNPITGSVLKATEENTKISCCQEE